MGSLIYPKNGRKVYFFRDILIKISGDVSDLFVKISGDSVIEKGSVSNPAWQINDMQVTDSGDMIVSMRCKDLHAIKKMPQIVTVQGHTKADALINQIFFIDKNYKTTVSRHSQGTSSPVGRYRKIEKLDSNLNDPISSSPMKPIYLYDPSVGVVITEHKRFSIPLFFSDMQFHFNFLEKERELCVFFKNKSIYFYGEINSIMKSRKRVQSVSSNSRSCMFLFDSSIHILDWDDVSSLSQNDFISDHSKKIDLMPNGKTIDIETGSEYLCSWSEDEAIFYDLDLSKSIVWKPEDIDSKSFLKISVLDGFSVVNTDNGFYFLNPFKADFKKINSNGVMI
jgi:hypothetical protein